MFMSRFIPGCVRRPDLSRVAAGLAALVATWSVGAQDAPRVEVQRFEFTGVSLLERAQLEAAVAGFRGPRTLEELRRAAEAVQRLYAEVGYAGVVAYLPPQPGSDGRITISVVEGKVARITVPGASPELAADVRAAVPSLREGQTPLVRRIDVQIEIANQNPSRQIALLLKPGAQSGEIDAEITVTEGKAHQGQAWLDNTGNERTGRWRAGLGWQIGNLSGVGDTLSFQASGSPTELSKVKILSAAYRRPLPGWLTVADVYVAYSDVDAGTSPTAAGDVRFSGRGNLAGVRATRSLLRMGSIDHRLALGLDWREYLNQCAIANLPAGSCGAAEADVAVTPLTLEYALRTSGAWPWTASVALVRNLGLGVRHGDVADFEAVRPGAERAYTTLRLQGQMLGDLAPGWQWRLRAAAQISRNALVPGEQFGLGGAVSVRGYEEREVAGDSGALVSFELTGPHLLPGGPGVHSLRPIGFAEGGRVSNRRDALCDADSTRCSAASMGLGLLYGGPGVQGRLSLGRAFTDSVNTRRGDARAHLDLNLSF